MLIRKNTKAFKTILEIFTACRDRQDREKLIRLYITKAGDTIDDRIGIEGIEGGAGLFYEMNYQAVYGNLKSPNHQLQQSDETAGLYFFHSSSNKVWDETPFEFDEAIKREFASLPDLPAVRKKEKVEKFAFPAPPKKSDTEATRKSGSTKTRDGAKAGGQGTEEKKESADGRKSARVVALWPKQPDYKLKHDIHFTGLERIAIRQAHLTKKDVLDYYNKMAEHLLPYLKDRPLILRSQSGGVMRTVESLAQNSPEDLPDWIRTATAGKGKTQEQLLLCNDREHLLFYVQIGALEFHAGLARVPGLDAPDYMILAIESSDDDMANTLSVALAAKEVLSGLQIPSSVKTDGVSGLHLYVPLDAKSDSEAARETAEYLCKLIRLKIPDLVTLKGSQGPTFGKVILDYSFNEARQGLVAPYSLIGQSAQVATPVSWDEVTEDLKIEAFTHETIFKRLDKAGDAFARLSKKKGNADALLKRLDEGYSFLL